MTSYSVWMLLAPGGQFAGHSIVDVLGRGGSSEVYLVDDGSGRKSALKVVVGEALRSPHAAGRLAREFDIAAGLHHPNIVTMHRYGTESGRPWLTMQYIDGYPASLLVPGPRDQPDIPLVLEVFTQVAAALDYAHSAGVVHRDVKPANVLVAAADPATSVLTDFGIARRVDDTRPLSRDGRVLGSIPYVAPEVLQAQKVVPNSDQYSLACSMVEVLTGKSPFPLTNRFAIAYAHRESRPPQLSARRRWIPRRVDTIIACGMAKNPRERYASCGELVAAVAAALSDVRPDTPPVRRRRRPRLPHVRLHRSRL